MATSKRTSKRSAPRSKSKARPSTRARRASPRKSAPRRFGGLGVLLRWTLRLFALGLVFALSFFAFLWLSLPAVDPLPDQDLDLSVQLVDREGQLIATYGDLVGAPILADDLPRPLADAIVAIEDRRFYTHFGIDPRGFARAMWVNVRAGRIVQGGSTLTQQLAKNVFLSPERTVWRKLQEMVLALKLELAYSKEEILAAYMNRVYLGARTYGFSAAAQRFFAKEVDELSLYEAAVLAGLLRAPSRTNPAANEDAAIRRASRVLDAMARDGLISADEVERLRGGPTNLLAAEVRRADAPDALYFADLAFSEFSELSGAPQGHLEVETTLDLELQRLAARLVEQSLARNGSAHNVSQAAVVVLGLDGQVRALVGGRSYSASPFNRAVQAQRQPGSTFKLFTFLAALEQGRVRPNTIIPDQPLTVEGWSPRNWDDEYRGQVTLEEAFAYSINAATVRLNETLGRQRALGVAQRLGVTGSPLRPIPSAPLGTNPVSLLEMVQAYTAVANRGQGVDAISVTQVRDAGNAQLLGARRNGLRGRVLDERVALDAQQLMQATVTYGTGQLGGFGRLSGGKTGTTSDSRDAWFIGYVLNHPRGGLVVGVWMGNDNNAPMQDVSGASLPADLYARLISQSLSLPSISTYEGQGARGSTDDTSGANDGGASRPAADATNSGGNSTGGTRGGTRGNAGN